MLQKKMIWKKGKIRNLDPNKVCSNAARIKEHPRLNRCGFDWLINHIWSQPRTRFSLPASLYRARLFRSSERIWQLYRLYSNWQVPLIA